ncbi:MAG TPA: Ada metal-binding domain-containing protein [Ruminococcus sp.]
MHKTADCDFYASCSSVDDMKESNKVFTNDYDQAIADGYKPCGRCKP